MIDFRYHLVSIVAIFLALATGVVVGGVALDASRVHDLQQRAASMQHERDGLRVERTHDQRQVNADTTLVAAISPQLTTGSLRGVAVSVVLAPGAGDSEQAAAWRIVQQGGATLASTIQLSPWLAAPAQGDLVDGVTNRVVPPGTALPAGTASTRAAVVIAAALTGRPGAGPSGGNLDGSGALTVLQAYAETKLLSLSGAPGAGGAPPFAPASTVLLVLPAAAPDRATQALDAALARGLAGRTTATVLAAPSGALPADPRASPGGRLSTVDGIETPQGQLIAVLTLAAAGQGHTGSYGASTGSVPPMTAPAPGSQH